ATTLPINPTVRVVDQFDNGVSSVTVNFAVQTGGGNVGSASVLSGSNGLAATTYTLGTTAGLNTDTMNASATVTGSPSTITFTESATAGPASQLIIQTQPSSNATAGVAFARQPVIRIA